jgi:hypothetical protein
MLNFCCQLEGKLAVGTHVTIISCLDTVAHF